MKLKILIIDLSKFKIYYYNLKVPFNSISFNIISMEFKNVRINVQRLHRFNFYIKFIRVQQYEML